MLAVSADAPAAVLVALGALAGLVAPPLGPFTRAALGRALRERGERLQRAYALDSAGEEAALIVAPLLVALARGAALARARRSRSRRRRCWRGRSRRRARRWPRRAAPPAAEAPRRRRCPRRCGCCSARSCRPAAALGAIDIAVPAAAREQGHVERGGRAAGGDGGRDGRRQPAGGPAALARGAAVARGRAAGRRWPAGSRSPRPRPRALELLGAALVVPGRGARRAVRDAYTCSPTGSRPPGSGTRTFAWLVTANNGGLALGAAAAGALSGALGRRRGAVVRRRLRARAASVPATVAAVMSARVLNAAPMSRTSLSTFRRNGVLQSVRGSRQPGRGHEPLEDARRLPVARADTRAPEPTHRHGRDRLCCVYACVANVSRLSSHRSRPRSRSTAPLVAALVPALVWLAPAVALGPARAAAAS